MLLTDVVVVTRGKDGRPVDLEAKVSQQRLAQLELKSKFIKRISEYFVFIVQVTKPPQLLGQLDCGPGWQQLIQAKHILVIVGINERVGWHTLLAGAVAIDRLFLEHPTFGSQALALGLVAIAFGVCGVGVCRWWATERALRQRRPLPGFGAPLLGIVAILLVGAGVVVLVLTPRG